MVADAITEARRGNPPQRLSARRSAAHRSLDMPRKRGGVKPQWLVGVKATVRAVLVITESETGWTAIMLKRLDWHDSCSGGAKTFENPLKPSEY